jgi:hypothetical protein
VRGIAGLRVIDSSIMPTAPRGNTNIPTIMLAEKISAGDGGRGKGGGVTGRQSPLYVNT